MKLFKGAVVGAVAVMLSASPLFADFSYTETTQITGGSMLGIMKMAGHFSRQARQAGEPIVSTVTIKGNKMSRVDPTNTEIIDLDAETITMIDNEKREYTVETFQQMKQQMEAAEAKAREEQAKHPEAAQQQQPSATQVKFTVHVRNTGQSKDVSGLNASESILTMNADATDTQSGQTGSMAFTNDMWMVPEIPGYSEVTDFYRKFAEKMGSVFSGSSAVNPAMLAQYRGATQGLKDMGEEMAKLKGTPVQQVMRMGTTMNGQTIPAASEAPLPASNGPAMPSAGDVAKDSAASTIASKLGGFGGFGGFGHKKQPQSQQPAASDSGSTQPPPYSVLMETNTQLGNFSRTASDAAFAIPAGFKQVPVRGVN